MKKLKVLLLFASLLFVPMAHAQIDNVKALKMALDDEYKAEAVYAQVIKDYGRVRPFSKILRSEQRHINALLPFFQKYGLEVPLNPYLGKVESYDSLAQACQAGVDGEIKNVELYNKIFALADDPDLIVVFERLQWASQNNHLPAFQRCAE